MEEYENKFHQKFNIALDETIQNVQNNIESVKQDSITFVDKKICELNTKFAIAS